MTLSGRRRRRPDVPGAPPGTERPVRLRPKLRYELIGCGFHGHELVGTDAAEVRPEDALIAREADGIRWHRCLRCDSWLPLPPPEAPTEDHLPDREHIDLPLRGRALRDRYVLRLISVERAVHVLVLGTITVAIFLFATHRNELKGDYTKILSELQGGLGGPIVSAHHGLFSDLNRLFSVSTAELYVVGAALALYTGVLIAETVGLWLARRWAEYLTLLESSVLIPFEIYELATTVSVLKILTLILNLAVVVYLLLSKRLFGIRGGARAADAARHADSGWPALEAATPYLGPAQAPPAAAPAPPS